MAFATSAVRDATNSEDVLARVHAETGVALQVLSGVDESRVQRFWPCAAGSAGARAGIINIDIGGGSLELSIGVDEEPEGRVVAAAGRRTADQGVAARRPARPPPRGHAA